MGKVPSRWNLRRAIESIWLPGWMLPFFYVSMLVAALFIFSFSIEFSIDAIPEFLRRIKMKEIGM